MQGFPLMEILFVGAADLATARYQQWAGGVEVQGFRVKRWDIVESMDIWALICKQQAAAYIIT